ncbi:GNAT family N-acetyltransferase [Streptomyces sp. NPDC018610]|uniref:GNAT family N-acetyltransferase n=1 Tax=Streptomyces sp. NPDC018610 TaxID=3365049 RepID=UPI0037A0DC27
MTGGTALASPPQPTAPTRYTVALARDEEDVRAAQRLRHDVFAGEMGALLNTPQPGHDIDPFDAYCDHLLVRDTHTGQVVGTYRLLPPERAAIAGRLYAESEFDLTALDAIRPGLVEVGRSCVHPDHRDGTVIGLIWAGLAHYMVAGGHEWLAGCCSIPLADGGALATATWNRVSARHLAPPEHRVRPLLPWIPRTAPAAPTGPGARTELPALLRGYLRLGARVCGEPAHDPDFGVADLYVLLSMRQVDPRYLRHFLSLVPA